MLLLYASTACAQEKSGTDSIQNVTFVAASEAPEPSFHRPARTIDGALTGGAGVYKQGPISPFQAMGSADFSGRTTNLDFIAGFHWGFSNPSTKGLSVGLRFPLIESATAFNNGIYIDPALLFFDNGGDSPAFQTGLRLAITGRIAPIECRLTGELRKVPLLADRAEGWVGFELGFFIDLLTEGRTETDRRDTLHAGLRYIATSNELDDLDKASGDEEIDRWLDIFWNSRNVTRTPQNDARREYMRRIELANRRFGTPRRMGTLTDMGRVLLLYGEPERTEDGASILGPQRRYELWVDANRVHGYRTAVFLFVAASSTSGVFENHGTYREIYSNLPGEPSEGIPGDLPVSMLNYINSFGR